jgi:hypothetical protein
VKIMLFLGGNEIYSNPNGGDHKEGHPAKDKCHASEISAAFAGPVRWGKVVGTVVIVGTHVIFVR